jgi:spermidine/putrescine transport system substrate-binding protein
MSKTLMLLTWPDYINPETMQLFEAEFGITVRLETVPSAVELMERMHLQQSPGVDVLVPPDYAVRALNAEGRLMTLNHSLLPNFEHIEPRFQLGRAHDPESRVSIIKDWGSTGFMYRTDMVDETLLTWADFWRLAEKYSGRVTVLDSPAEVIGAALKMRGYSYNASSEEALSAARQELLRLKPHLRKFETDYKPLLASGEACVSLGWNGDAAALNTRGIPVKYVLPNEGSQIWEDDWAIAADSPSSEAAHLFLNFVLRPEIAAEEARYTRYATGNRSAFALLEEEIRNDRSTYPSEEVLTKLEAGMPLDEEGQRRREALWMEVRG